jgi:hypothetical protein
VSDFNQTLASNFHRVLAITFALSAQSDGSSPCSIEATNVKTSMSLTTLVDAKRRKTNKKTKKEKTTKMCVMLCVHSYPGARTFFPFGADNTECGTAGIFGMFLLPRRDTHTHTRERETLPNGP